MSADGTKVREAVHDHKKATQTAEKWVSEMSLVAQPSPALDNVMLSYLALRKTHQECGDALGDAMRELAAVSRPAEARGEVHGGLTFAPWTHEQVANLNAWQERGDRHPFTCGRDGCGEVLAAVPEGWVCPSETCDYTQNWAHNFMADRADPRPEPGDPSEAMVEAHIAARRCENAVKPNGFENGSHADLYCPDCVRLRLTAALAAREGA